MSGVRFPRNAGTHTDECPRLEPERILLEISHKMRCWKVMAEMLRGEEFYGNSGDNELLS